LILQLRSCASFAGSLYSRVIQSSRKFPLSRGRPAREETVAPEPAVEIVPEPASAQDSEPAPRTVGELVALRKRQAEAAAAGTEAPETPPADD